jgi:DNA-binding NarL/FixJ family response regulator
MIVTDTKQKCNNCGGLDYLADGLCSKCWDKGAESKAFRLTCRNSLGIPKNRFTTKEIEVLVLISKGMTNETIAKELHNDVKTIERHCNKIYHMVKTPEWSNRRVWIAVNVKKVLDEKRV